MSHDWSLLVRWRKYAGGNQKWSRFKNVYSAIGKLMSTIDSAVLCLFIHILMAIAMVATS